MAESRRFDSFQKWALLTTFATFFLIGLGGLVRASGSGLGCPDWPRCFGLIIPPTHVSELPPGFDPASFNVVKTWIEYINRMVGATIGLLIFATMVSAFRNHRDERRVLWPTVAAFLCVGFEGWLGALVVRSELRPALVTAHLLVALVLVGLLLYATVNAFYGPPRSKAEVPEALRRLERWAILLLLLGLVQTGLGAMVRGTIDTVVIAEPELLRGTWLAEVGPLDLVHRQIGALTFLCTLVVAGLTLRNRQIHPHLRRTAIVMLSFCAVQIGLGLTLAYAELPPAAQMLHILVGSLLIGSDMVLAFLARRLPPIAT